ncbi:MAG TPA: c-type cytochrome [Longimicrobium sp.]
MRSPWMLLMAALALSACGGGPDKKAMETGAALTRGDPHAGREQIRHYGCNACHTIPGIQGAHGAAGPPLGGMVGRMYIAGVLTNTPEHMVRWIQDPPGIDPKTAMPNLGVTEEEARDIAAYLYALK